jgi:hypothetical protein
METMTETGTEKRVDELSKRVDFGFEQLDKRMEEGFERADRNFERVDADLRELRVAITSLHRAMFVFTGTTVGSILAGIVVIVITSHS